MPRPPSTVEHPNRELIVNHCNQLIATINQEYAYYPSTLFKIASLMAYGLHRPKVWNYELQPNGTGHFSVSTIEQVSISQQADLVFSGLKDAHMMFCQHICLEGKSKDLKEHSINILLKDLLNKIAAVIVQKEVYQSNRHERSTCEQLNQSGMNIEDPLIREKILPLIYATEIDDQRCIFQSVLSRYNEFLSGYNEKGKRAQFIRSQSDFLLNHREITCWDLIKFNLKDKKQSNIARLKRFFFDFLRDKPPFTGLCTIKLNDDSHHKPFDRCISRPQPQLISATSSPTSVTKVAECQNYYSLFGEKKLIDDETLRWIREGCTTSNSI